MAAPAAPRTDAFVPPSSEELRQRALARSSQRGAGVARRRLWWRWFLWGLWRALAVLAMLAAVAYGLLMAWRAWADEPRPVNTPRPAAPQRASELPLRLDDAEATRPAAKSADPASTPPSAPTSESIR